MKHKYVNAIKIYITLYTTALTFYFHFIPPSLSLRTYTHIRMNIYLEELIIHSLISHNVINPIIDMDTVIKIKDAYSLQKLDNHLPRHGFMQFTLSLFQGSLTTGFF